MKRLIKWLIVLGVLGGGVALLIVKARPQPPVVQVEPVRRGSLSGTVSSVSSGMVEPTRRVTLQAESVARVTAVRIKRGDRVKAGAVLVELNAADLADQLRSLSASMPLLQSRVEQAKTRLEQLKVDHKRIARLAERGVAAPQQLDSATSARDLAAGELDAARAALEQARVNLNVTRGARRKTVVTAPFDGLVLDVNVEVGDQASGYGSSLTGSLSASSSGGTTASSLLSSSSSRGGLVEIADDREMFVLADVDELDYGRLALGQAAQLTFDALRKRTLVGKLVEIFPYVSRTADQNRSVRVKIRLPDEARGVVLPGMSVNVEIITEHHDNVLVVPMQCVISRPEGKAVLRVEGDLLREVPVKLGIATFDRAELTAGVSEGDRVAVPSTEIKLSAGMRVVVRSRNGGLAAK